MYEAYSRGVFEAGLQTNAVHMAQLREQTPAEFAALRPVLVAAAFTIATDEDLAWLRQYAEAGGHLVVGIRTGYEDQKARARLERKPALLDETAGVWYDEFSNLREPLPLIPGETVEGLALPGGALGTLWADGLQPTDDSTTVLARYEHPHYGRWPAITTREAGAGRVTYVGTVPDPIASAALMTWAVEVGAGTPAWARSTDSQSVSTSTNGAGERVHVIHNWSWEPSVFTLPAASRDVLSDEELATGTELELGAWDVRVVIEKS